MYRRWYVQLHKFLLSIPVPSTLYFDVLYDDILDDVSQISKPMKNFMYANQAHRFQSQIETSYFVESLPVAASIKRLLLYVLINFKSQFQELKHRSTSKTTKKGIKRKKMLVKRQIDQVRAQVLWESTKVFEPYCFLFGSINT